MMGQLRAHKIEQLDDFWALPSGTQPKPHDNERIAERRYLRGE